MSGGWLDIHAPGAGPSAAGVARREALLEGLTRVGGPGCDVVLPGAGEDQLHVWNRPPRLVFIGRGARPLSEGRAFEERALRPGDRVEWAGHVLVYGGEASGADQALLEELPDEGVVVSPTPRVASRLEARVRAGLACELGLADPQAQKRWRQAVLENRFEPDACAGEILKGELGAEAEQRLLERSGTLLRDFLMAALLSGSAGARRKLREGSRGLMAFLLTQGLALLVFAALVATTLLVLRVKGTSIDALLDRLLPR